MSDFNVSGEVKVDKGIVVSVEKGNVEKSISTSNKVCAFSMQVEGSSLPVKVILKGDTAVSIWENELKDCKTLCSGSNKTYVNMVAELREIRQKEFVIHKPTSIEFYKTNIYKVNE